jgi:hypothetical protein
MRVFGPLLRVHRSRCRLSLVLVRSLQVDSVGRVLLDVRCSVSGQYQKLMMMSSQALPSVLRP